MGQPASNVLDAFKDLVPPLPDLTTGAFRPGRPHRDAATCARYRRRYAGTNDSVTWSCPPMRLVQYLLGRQGRDVGRGATPAGSSDPGTAREPRRDRRRSPECQVANSTSINGRHWSIERFIPRDDAVVVALHVDHHTTDYQISRQKIVDCNEWNLQGSDTEGVGRRTVVAGVVWRPLQGDGARHFSHRCMYRQNVQRCISANVRTKQREIQWFGLEGDHESVFSRRSRHYECGVPDVCANVEHGHPRLDLPSEVLHFVGLPSPRLTNRWQNEPIKAGQKNRPDIALDRFQHT